MALSGIVNLLITCNQWDFEQTKLADTDLWMHDRGDYYEFVAVLVDDLLAFAREPDKVIEPLQKVFMYELKGLGTPEYYSGALM